MINKRGDIPVTILVMGVVLICLAAVLTFFISGSKFSNGFSSVETVSKAALMGEKIGFYEKTGMGFSQISGLESIQNDATMGNYLNVTGQGVEVIYLISSQGG